MWMVHSFRVRVSQLDPNDKYRDNRRADRCAASDPELFQHIHQSVVLSGFPHDPPPEAPLRRLTVNRYAMPGTIPYFGPLAPHVVDH
jgi:hypothetical protein